MVRPTPVDAIATGVGDLVMPQDRCETAPTEFVQIADVQVAYRRFGKPGTLPLLLLNYFAANMDDWDPAIANGLAVDRDIIVFDYPGVGRSTGAVPSSVEAMTRQLVSFCRALHLDSFDIVGFSLGGMIAQQVAFEFPEMVRRIMLLGTDPRGGEGMTFTELSVDDLSDPVKLLTNAFFTPSDASQAAGRAYLERLKIRAADRDELVSMPAAVAQLDCIREWGAIPSANRFAMLSRIHQPTLIVHGNKDVVVEPINAFLMAEHLPNAQLIMYPDASHGAQSQHAKVFLEHARLFLS
jgi:pimeloyl-ACP methyl ester carboxylesterase